MTLIITNRNKGSLTLLSRSPILFIRSGYGLTITNLGLAGRVGRPNAIYLHSKDSSRGYGVTALSNIHVGSYQSSGSGKRTSATKSSNARFGYGWRGRVAVGNSQQVHRCFDGGCFSCNVNPNDFTKTDRTYGFGSGNRVFTSISSESQC